jgi:hypothetical protein
MVGHLDIDVVWRDWLRTSPALVDNVGNLLRDVQTPFVTPPFVKPLCQFFASVMVGDIDVQFPLLRQPREGQIAAA